MNRERQKTAAKVVRSMPHAQSGVIMIICLVLLLVVTSLGLSSMNNTSLQMKMSSSFRSHSGAFEAAEAAISTAETWIDDAFIDDTDLSGACTGSTCFNEDCDNGLCFFHSSTYAVVNPDPQDCGGYMDPPGTPVWQWAGATGEPNLWEDNAKTVAVSSSHPDIQTDARYLIEFICYADKTDAVACGATADTCAPQFRITALGRGFTDNSMVMLQSIYKKVN